MDPTSDSTRVPSFAAAKTSSLIPPVPLLDKIGLPPASVGVALLPISANARFCAMRGRLASLLVHSTDHGSSPGQRSGRSKTIRPGPLLKTSNVKSAAVTFSPACGFRIHLMTVASLAIASFGAASNGF